MLLTDTIIKINRFNMSQSRYILVTDIAIYNYKKKSKKFLKKKNAKEELI
jgi:hypothetical protein